jgi:hypothetical protein
MIEILIIPFAKVGYTPLFKFFYFLNSRRLKDSIIKADREKYDLTAILLKSKSISN